MFYTLVWDFLEQLATAAIDIGQLELANVRLKVLRNAWNVYNHHEYSQDCITRLNEHFPNSPRVEILRGLCIEAKDLNLAYKYYADLLQEDESNAVRFNCSLMLRSHTRYNFQPFIGGLETAGCYSTKPEQI